MCKRGRKIRDDFLTGLRFALGGNFPEQQIDKICITISKTYGGEAVYISKSYARQLSVRNDSIKQKIQNGARPSQLVEIYGLSKRQIERIVKK